MSKNIEEDTSIAKFGGDITGGERFRGKLQKTFLLQLGVLSKIEDAQKSRAVHEHRAHLSPFGVFGAASMLHRRRAEHLERAELSRVAEGSRSCGSARACARRWKNYESVPISKRVSEKYP